jgi:ribosomal protein S18 acetylase RimI-like enzyme
MYQFRPYAVVENIIVNPAFRGNGIGKSLLAHVEQLCVLRGCTKIMLLSSASRVEAHEFFKKNGFNGSVSRGFKKYIPIS